MNRNRRRGPRICLSVLAMVALLWSQILLAGHPGCSMAAMALAQVAAPMVAERDCHQPGPSSGATLCEAHCSQGDQSSDVNRVAPVPALALPLVVDFALIVRLEDEGRHGIALPPPVAWHRPTLHPAKLLLI